MYNPLSKNDTCMIPDRSLMLVWSLIEDQLLYDPWSKINVRMIMDQRLLILDWRFMIIRSWSKNDSCIIPDQRLTLVWPWSKIYTRKIRNQRLMLVYDPSSNINDDMILDPRLTLVWSLTHAQLVPGIHFTPVNSNLK